MKRNTSFELQIEVPPEISVESIGLEASIEKAVQYLWDLDVNRLIPFEDYEINVQKGKKPYYSGDFAGDPFFTFVDGKALNRRTYKTFIALLDNYSAEVDAEEEETPEKEGEISDFLDAIMDTGPMQFCMKYCAVNNAEIPSDRSEFKDLLRTIWFKLYRRARGVYGSSGFEHVFTGEIKNDEVSGFHNWIQLYIEEKKGNVDYYGYIKPRSKSDEQTNENDHLLTLQFAWNGVMKKQGTMFIGVSPEFEMALYTLCFLMGNEENILSLCTEGEVFEMNIKCFKMAGEKIGTTFPLLLHHHEE